MKNSYNFISGKKRDISHLEKRSIIYPGTGEQIGLTQFANEELILETIELAKKSQKVWSGYTRQERSKVLLKAAEMIRQNLEELATLEVYDTGKPIQEAFDCDINSGAEALSYYASYLITKKDELYDFGNNYAHVKRIPLGVVCGIGAWNYPFQIACWKSAPALAAGNAMIYKPSELTTMTAVRLAEIYKEAGLPDGVFNVLQGDHRVGQILVRHPDIKKISLTGEVETGKKVMGMAAQNLTNVTLELGGKSPLIVFDDAKIENAVQASLLANFYTQGEICSNGTRVFVHEKIIDKFLNRLLEVTQQLVVGDPLNLKTHIGSLISKDHMEKVLKYIDIGVKEGAELLFGGKRIFTHGYYVGPTIFAKCHDEMRIVKEEIFGPVMSILTFKNKDEVINRANKTKFGLASGIFTENINLANEVANRLESGITWVNNYNLTPLEIPFGGSKESGLGRENSSVGYESYTEVKTIYFETGDVDSPYKF